MTKATGDYHGRIGDLRPYGGTWRFHLNNGGEIEHFTIEPVTHNTAFEDRRIAASFVLLQMAQSQGLEVVVRTADRVALELELERRVPAPPPPAPDAGRIAVMVFGLHISGTGANAYQVLVSAAAHDRTWALLLPPGPPAPGSAADAQAQLLQNAAQVRLLLQSLVSGQPLEMALRPEVPGQTREIDTVTGVIPSLSRAEAA